MVQVTEAQGHPPCVKWKLEWNFTISFCEDWLAAHTGCLGNDTDSIILWFIWIVPSDHRVDIDGNSLSLVTKTFSIISPSAIFLRFLLYSSFSPTGNIDWLLKDIASQLGQALYSSFGELGIEIEKRWLGARTLTFWPRLLPITVEATLRRN